MDKMDLRKVLEKAMVARLPVWKQREMSASTHVHIPSLSILALGAHIQDESPLLIYSPGKDLKDSLEVCLLGDFKSGCHG